jgi:hypothetical protein
MFTTMSVQLPTHTLLQLVERLQIPLLGRRHRLLNKKDRPKPVFSLAPPRPEGPGRHVLH